MDFFDFYNQVSIGTSINDDYQTNDDQPDIEYETIDVKASIVMEPM